MQKPPKGFTNVRPFFTSWLSSQPAARGVGTRHWQPPPFTLNHRFRSASTNFHNRSLAYALANATLEDARVAESLVELHVFRPQDRNGTLFHRIFFASAIADYLRPRCQPDVSWGS